MAEGASSSSGRGVSIGGKCLSRRIPTVRDSGKICQEVWNENVWKHPKNSQSPSSYIIFKFSLPHCLLKLRWRWNDLNLALGCFVVIERDTFKDYVVVKGAAYFYNNLATQLHRAIVEPFTKLYATFQAFVDSSVFLGQPPNWCSWMEVSYIAL